MLRDYKDHLDYRWEQYNKTKEAIVKAHGSLAEFAKVRGGGGVCMWGERGRGWGLQGQE